MNNYPLVSIIVPTHNRPTLLSNALDSLQNQSFQKNEVIVIDDASATPVSSAISKHDYDFELKVARKEVGEGGAAAKNTGISLAVGQYIAFLDDDDMYEPSFIESAVRAFNLHPEIEVIFMGVNWFGDFKEEENESYLSAVERVIEFGKPARQPESLVMFDEHLLAALLPGMPMCFQRPVVRRSALSKTGTYESDCLLWDCDFALRAAAFANCALINQGLYKQRTSGQGYFSQPGRLRKQTLSNIEMKERLLKLLRVHDSSDRQILALQRSIHLTYLALAYYHRSIGEFGSSISALLNSARYGYSTKQLKSISLLAASYLGVTTK